MAKTYSTMLELGAKIPQFALLDTKGELYRVVDQKIDKGLLVMFICNHCPFVQHILEQLVDDIRYYQQKGISVVAINANDYAAYPEDSPQKMAELAEKMDFSFPYLLDDSQAIAKAFKAACTPDFFLFDNEQTLVYRGQYDASRPGNTEPLDGRSLGDAVSKLSRNIAIEEEQRPSLGCNIKWREGNEPDYF